MTFKERIIATINFQRPDRPAVWDYLTDDTLKAWQSQGMPKDIAPENYFDYDISLFSLDVKMGLGKALDSYEEARKKDRYLVLAVEEPFQSLTREFGLQQVLENAAGKPKWFEDCLGTSTHSILKKSQWIFDKGYKFDGAWFWGDLGYKDGTYFSAASYKRLLQPFHKRLFDFFRNNDAEIFFHSDGDIKAFIGPLLDIGVRVLNPLEADYFDILHLRKEFGKDLVCFGNVSTKRILAGGDIENYISQRRSLALDGGVILSFDSPIPPELSLSEYKEILKWMRLEL